MKTNELIIEAGIPRLGNYKRLLETSLFRNMEAFSDVFLEGNEFLHDHYKWVKDPLHQWSRQWEYPYVFQSMMAYSTLRQGLPIEVLDAGSGITFFPYYLKRSIQNLNITCCDSDNTLTTLFDRVNRSLNFERRVNFVEADMHLLPLGDESVDIIYCISVLEHTRNYAHILDEFHRILRPNGRLVLSFDIGLDGVSEIAPSTARHLLDNIAQRFAREHGAPDITIDMKNILTSKQIIQDDSRLSPWKFPRLALIKAALRAKRMPTSVNKNLTVYCETFVRLSTPAKRPEDRMN